MVQFGRIDFRVHWNDHGKNDDHNDCIHYVGNFDIDEQNMTVMGLSIVHTV